MPGGATSGVLWVSGHAGARAAGVSRLTGARLRLLGNIRPDPSRLRDGEALTDPHHQEPLGSGRRSKPRDNNNKSNGRAVGLSAWRTHLEPADPVHASVQSCGIVGLTDPP